MSFLISASEAVLLGRAFEEYLQATTHDDRARFLDYLWTCVRPFSPSIARDRWDQLQESDLPGDLEWALNDVGKVGFAPSLPNAWFLGAYETDLVARITRDRTARSLVELVAELVAPHVERWPADDVAFNIALPGCTPWGQFQQQRFAASGECDLQDAPCGVDDPAAIEAVLSALVARPDNAHGDFFRLGRVIGELLGHCDFYEADFCLFEELEFTQKLPFSRIDPSTWRSLVREPLRELTQASVFEPFSAAVTVLAAQGDTLDAEFDQNDAEAEFRTLQSVRSAVSLALGGLLHVASRTDFAAPRTERPAVPRLLRMTRLTKESPVDKIRATLQFCEGLFEDRGAAIFPEHIIATLANGIEALARRIWPRTFASQGPKSDVGSVLKERCRNGSDAERRFASIAMMLYKTYRNASQHDFDNFRCTWSEAFFFFCGMQQLWQLSEQMGDRKRGRD